MKRSGLAPVLAVAIGVALASRGVRADDVDVSAKNERCAIHLSIAITGEAPNATLLAAGDPQSQVPTLLKSEQFREKFARFINATYNRNPADEPGGDAPYYLTKHVLEEGKPWKDLGLPQLNGKSKAFSTNPRESVSGNMFATLFIDMANGDMPVTSSKVSRSRPRITCCKARLA